MKQTRVLVADDSRLDRTLLHNALSSWGYTVVLAENGATAVDLLRANGDIQLAIVDWMIPDLSGPDVCRAVAKLDRFIYIIVLTGRSRREGLSEALSAGAADFISKPFEAAELEARVRSAFRILDLQTQILQMQKMDSVGRLAAGIAHEINTPIQYVGDNTRFLEGSFGGLLGMVRRGRALLGSLERGDLKPEEIEEVQAEWQEADLDYLMEEIPRAISESLEGVARVSSIVAAMKEFSHPGGDEAALADLHAAIESTITVTRNEWKYSSDMRIDFAPDMPPVPCLIGEMKQVILNLIVNAAHAIASREGADTGRGTITIGTAHGDGWAEIRVADTGTGIPPEVQAKVFEPFFTTKDVGRGTGQGLALAHAVVEHKHGGTIRFETEVGKGTTFIVRLPLEPVGVPVETTP